MTAGHPVRERRPPGRAGPALPRLLLIALLLAGVLVGLRGGFTAPGLHGPLRHDSVAVGAALEAMLAVLLAVLLVWDRQRPTGDFATRRLRVVLRALLLAGLAAIPIVLLAYGPLRGPLPAEGHARPLPAQSLRASHAQHSSSAHLPLTGLLYTLLGLVLLAAIVACVLLLRRRRRRGTACHPRRPRWRTGSGPGCAPRCCPASGDGRAGRRQGRYHRLLPGHGTEPGRGRGGPDETPTPRPNSWTGPQRPAWSARPRPGSSPGCSTRRGFPGTG